VYGKGTILDLALPTSGPPVGEINFGGWGNAASPSWGLNIGTCAPWGNNQQGGQGVLCGYTGSSNSLIGATYGNYNLASPPPVAPDIPTAPPSIPSDAAGATAIFNDLAANCGVYRH